jgi:hypothetical protein
VHHRDVTETLTGILPLAEDPDFDPPDWVVIETAQSVANRKAAERGLVAGPVRITERRPGLFNDDGTYALDPYGHPIASRAIFFKADCSEP